MLTRVASASRALSSCLRTLAALQTTLSAHLGSQGALQHPFIRASYDISTVPPWQRRTSLARWLSMDAAAAAAEEPQPAEYRVVVVTGDVRGAGSSAPAVIVLIGEGVWGDYGRLHVGAPSQACVLLAVGNLPTVWLLAYCTAVPQGYVICLLSCSCRLPVLLSWLQMARVSHS